MLIGLVGYMGSGKSTVGKLLAQACGIPFVDLDDYLEKRMGKSISEIFAQQGEIFFRKQEHLLLKELLEKGDDMVLALGGGTPCYAGNMDLLLSHTQKVCYLQMSVPGLARRLGQEQEQRPLIAHLSREELPEFIGKHLFERVPFYSKAPYAIICDHQEPAEIANEFLELIG